MKTHPAADLFPMMTGDDFDNLKADIAKNGMLEPIWIYDGMILDGRNRYRACSELGITLETREHKGDSPTAFVWSLNGARRHMTTSQLGAVAAKMQPALQVEAAKRRAAHLKQGKDSPLFSIDNDGKNAEAPAGRSAEIAAKLVGVGTATVTRAQFVMKNDAELFKQIETGDVTVTNALKAIKTKQPPAKANKKPKAERVTEIEALASEGHRATQIASKLGISVHQVRSLAKTAEVALPDAKIGKVHGINIPDLIERTVRAIEAYADGLAIIKGTSLEIESDLAKEFAKSLTKSIRELGWLRNEMREIAS